ncbi:liprin-beta-1 isoform X2 [Papilio machaon]|uniref:liprin-beta-1 isoform X2 n=1 Tax=Papilio machaon TaxID=76193 RepID=UPI001E665BF6|nr:liprin-beta-1 isoform X2 [Papilio machaon]
MRELGRGGSFVAATIAALHNRSAVEKHQAFNSLPAVEKIAIPERRSEDNFFEELSRRTSAASERPRSTASEASGRDSASVQSSEEAPPHESGDSDSPDEATVKCKTWTDGAVAPQRANSSDTESSTTSDDDSEEHEYETGCGDADYHTLTPNSRRDNSTRCDHDFKWMPSGDIMEEGAEAASLGTRPDDYNSASLDRRRRRTGSRSDRSDRDRKSRSSLNSKPPQHPSSVRASPRPRRPRNEETPPDLQRRWNSYEHFRWPEGGWYPPMCWCHGPPAPPPCCMHDRAWPSHPSLPPMPTSRSYKNDAEDRVRRLEADKESLQLQVQVLSEQIAAQTEKMADLERSLNETRQKLDDTEQRLQKEMLSRSSLETQKLELLSKLSEVRLRVVERGVLERSPPPDAAPLPRPAPPRTPPANYGRQIERNTHLYSSLPRSSVLTSEARVAFGKQNNMVVARGRGHSVPNLAEKEEAVPRGSPSPSLREVRARLGSGGGGGGGGVRLEGDEFARGGLRASAPRRVNTLPRQTRDIREWDCEMTCQWLEGMGLESYVSAARAWLGAAPDSRGVLANASHATIEKELAIKHPMHKKKIILAVTDLMGGHGDPLLSKAGSLDTAWALRWLEDAGVCGARGAAADAALDGRLLHRLTHNELHTHLRVTHALHALSIRRGIQVLRENEFNPETMVRRAAEGEAPAVEGEAPSERAPADLARWSSHRVMQWLKEIDLAEYAPNLRGAGVHGGLMLLEPRFTAELLAALLNIPANKTLLRRHLTQRFNDLLGREVIQQKRNAEQTLGYQPLTATTKYKVPKKSQFSLKRKKSREELELCELVCPLREDASDDESKVSSSRRVGCLSPA